MKKARCLAVSGSNSDWAIQQSTSNVTISWLGLIGGHGLVGCVNANYNSAFVIDHCIFKGDSNYVAAIYGLNNSISINVLNCAFIGNYNIALYKPGGSAIHAVNCSFDGGTVAYDLSAGGTIYVDNCISANDYHATSISGGDYNVGVGVTAPGTHHWDNQTNVFVSSTDLHLQSGAATAYAVPDLSATYPSLVVDIDNVTRSGTWYAGCAIYVAPPAGANTGFFALMGSR